MFHSFKELAKVHGPKLVEKELKQHGTSLVIATKCGHKAETIWSLFQYRESCKVYGVDGKIILSPQEIAELTGFTVETVTNCCLNLVRNGYLRLAENGQSVKAA